MSRVRAFMLCLGLALVAASCSGSADDSASPDPEVELNSTSSTEAATTIPAPTSTTTSTTSPTTPPPDFVDPAVALAGVEGLVAVAGQNGLRVLTPTGDVVAEFGADLQVSQPTWSRDSTRLAATFIDAAAGEVSVAIIDSETWELTILPAARPYFFYTWNDDASLLAALGGAGALGGTEVDILDTDGVRASNVRIVGGSMYVAWEPGGDDLLLHADDQMRLIDDFSAAEDFVDFGTSGLNFQAASWIPGTRDFLFVDSTGDTGRLIRRNVDSGETIDLGEASGFASISVHPDGGSAALAHGSDGEGGTVLVSQSNAQLTTAVDVVDLTTGDRQRVIDSPGLWLEWSPDGTQLLIATAVPGGLAWRVWDGTTTADLGQFTPTPAFFQRYVSFADQYTETPRLWSPDGAAFSFGSFVDGAGVATAISVGDGAQVRLGDGEVAFWSPTPIE